MARFLYAWELGGNLGHVGAFAPVAGRLQHAGHDIHLVVRDTRACALLPGARCDWSQAPHCDAPPGPAAPLSYADILAGVGYLDCATLMGLLVAWRTQLTLTRPDLVFADHAPTAILAARTLGIPVMLFGSGFTAPPPCSPFPPMRHWEALEPAALAALGARERRVLGTINDVLTTLHVPLLVHLCDLFDVAENALLTVPELDHYRHRPAARYWGLPCNPPAAAVSWPPGAGPRIYAYLRHERALTTAIIAAIGHLTASSIVFCPDWTDAMGCARGMTIVTRPVALTALAREADIAIANGASTIGAFLMAGKPVLSLAIHLEHYLSGLRVMQLGAGLVLRADGPFDALAPALARLHTDGSYTEQARAFATRYADLHGDAVIAALCERALALALHH